MELRNCSVISWHYLRSYLLVLLVTTVLISCGSASENASVTTGIVSNTSAESESNSNGWLPGVFLSARIFQNRCEVPVPGTSDIQGTSLDENNFLRSYSNNTYLWYDEIVDRDPSLYSTAAYFELLKTNERTPSGNLKDKFHFSIPTEVWLALSQSGTSAGYGAQFIQLQTAQPRLILVAYTEPGTPATASAAGLVRGTQILEVDGINVANSSNVDALNAGLFPATVGESHTFTVRDPNGTIRTFTMQSAVITSTPVQNVSIITTLVGKVGYMLFNAHIATAEGSLYNAVTQLAAAGINNLVVDIRYNGGGFLDIASELAYMIAGPVPTAGRPFEEIRFNDKHPLINPVTGQTLSPLLFHNRSLGFDPALPAGTLLPSLGLPRVYILTGSNTCSASESIINSLRGVDVEVIQIGTTTCGKPYGFYPTNNCGTTYFTTQFQGVNAKGFGDYSDGFSPANTVGNVGTVVPGCAVADDFSAALGDPVEARLSAALTYIETGACPDSSHVSFGHQSAPQLFSHDPLPEGAIIVPTSVLLQNRIMRQ